MKIHLIAPYWANYPHGLESRLVYSLNKKDIQYTITDMRTQPLWKFDCNLRQKYDATIVIKGEKLWDTAVKALQRPSILWFPDDILTYDAYANLIRQNGKYYDLVYSFDFNAIDKYKELGCKNVKFLPLCAGKDIHKNMKIERDINISFCCNLNNDRKFLLDYLGDHNIHVYNKPSYGKELVNIYNRSKIVINMAQGNTGISQRVFEGMACGALVLTNNISKEAKIFDNDEIIYWDNLDDLEKKIKYYLKNDSERIEIANNGYKKIFNDHMMDNRLDTILSDIERLK